MKILFGLCLFFTINSGACKAAESFEDPLNRCKHLVKKRVDAFIKTLSPDRVDDRYYALRHLQNAINTTLRTVQKNGFPTSAPPIIPISPIVIPEPKDLRETIWDLEAVTSAPASVGSSALYDENLLIKQARLGSDAGVYQCIKLLATEENHKKQQVEIDVINALGKFMIALRGFDTKGLSKKENLNDAAHTLYATAKIRVLQYRNTCDKIIEYLAAEGKDGDTFIQAILDGFSEPSVVFHRILTIGDRCFKIPLVRTCTPKNMTDLLHDVLMGRRIP